MEEQNASETPEPARPPPLPVTEKELAALDESIALMAKTGREHGVQCESMRQLREDTSLCRKIDEFLADALIALRKGVPEDTAEKLFERLSKVVDDWKDRDEQMVLGAVFVRFMDTMTYFIAYKQKFRGVARTSSISKADALAVLKERGLTKR